MVDLGTLGGTCFAMTDQQIRVLFRLHNNGMIASVAYVHTLGLFLAGAERPGVAHYEGTTSTLYEAKAMADRASGCPQPCTCSAWGSFE